MKKYIAPDFELDMFALTDIVMGSYDLPIVPPDGDGSGGNTGGGSTGGDTDIASIIRGALGM